MKTKLFLITKPSSFDRFKNSTLKAFVFTIINCLILISANAQIKEQWLKEYNGPIGLETYNNAIIVDNNDNIIIAGATQTGTTGFNYFIRKYTPAGDTVWTTIYYHPNINVNWHIQSFIQDANKNFYILGSVGGSGSNQDVLIAKFNSNGVFLWAEVYNGPDNFGDHPQAIAVDNSGNIYVTAEIGGLDHSGLNQTTYWGIIKYNSNFIKQWVKIIDYNGYLYVRSSPQDIKIDDAGNIYVTGLRSSLWQGYQGVMTIKYDPSGNELWRYIYDGQNGNSGGFPNASVGNKILITPDNNIFTACFFNDTYGTGAPNDTTYSYLLTVLYSPNGNILQQSVDTTVHNFSPQKIMMGHDGNIYLTGYTFPTYTTSTDSAILKLKFNSSGLQLQKTSAHKNSIIDFNWDNCFAIDSAYNIYCGGTSYSQVNNWASYSYWPVTLKMNTTGSIDFAAEYNRGFGEGYTAGVAVDSEGNIYSVGYLYNSDYTNVTGILLKYCPKCNNLISGKVYREINGNCIQDTAIGEAGLKNWKVKIEPSSLYTTTDINGNYLFYVDSGNYVVTQVISDTVLNKKCTSTPEFYQISVLPGSSNTGYNFADMVAVYCPHLWVDISSGSTRKCRRNVYSVSYSNNGTDTAINAYIKVKFDTSVIVLSSTLSWNSHSGNTYVFNLGNLYPGQSGNFLITDSISCNAILNSALCSEAIIYPDTNCTPVDPIWDKSSISVTGKCKDDSLACFIIHNNGLSMTGTSDYRIFTNNILMVTQHFQLNAGDSLVVCFPANGKTIRFEADQRPGHPGHSHPKKIIEGCGTPSVYGNVTTIAQDDADDNKDIDCQIVRGSLDPNEKLVQPEGITTNKFTSSSDDLEYQINFQNTGNDTAFFVVIRDTLSEYLDPATVVSGASSNPYVFRISGIGILEWKFNNIMLPDSNVNEPTSHGFVKFNVKQKANNPKGSIIWNSAAIYFDYNTPIITNEVWNMVYDTTLINFITPIIIDNKTNISIYPNPFNNTATILVDEKIIKQNTNVELKIFDLLGREIKKIILKEKYTTINRSGLRNGVYLYKITSNNKITDSGKLIIN